ncbi:MAG: hypothetical protein PHV48_05530, partial [Candidatus Omnitrophica bacterium]|nr:hypothetical protein [Candidatus Omnitrophota bacterium]
QTIDLKFINIWFTALVYYMKNRELEITPETIQNIANTPKDQRGAKLFQLKDTRFFTHEILPAVDDIITMRVKRGKPGEKPRYYIAEYSTRDGKLKIYPELKDGTKIARRASMAKSGDQGENPAAATRQGAPLSYLLHHPLLNSLIGMALTPLSDETMKIERVDENLENGTFKQIYFLGNEDDASFLDIFNRLALLRAQKNHRTKANGSDEMAIVVEMLNIARLNAPNGSLNNRFVETIKAQLALQIDHFGVENTDSIYTLKRYYKNRSEIVAHAELERRIHNKCIEKLGSTKYRDWRQNPGTKEETVEISDISEAHPDLRGKFTYNGFTQAAHNIAEAEHPLTHIAPPLGSEKRYENIVAGNQSPVAGTRKGNRHAAALQAGLFGFVMSEIVIFAGLLIWFKGLGLSGYFYLIPIGIAGLFTFHMLKELFESSLYKEIEHVKTFNPYKVILSLLESFINDYEGLYHPASVESVTKDWTFEQYVIAIDVIDRSPLVRIPSIVILEMRGHISDLLLKRLKANEIPGTKKDRLAKAVINAIMGDLEQNEWDKKDAVRLWREVINYPANGEDISKASDNYWLIKESLELDTRTFRIERYYKELLLKIGRQEEAYLNTIDIMSLDEAINADILSGSMTREVSEKRKGRIARLWDNFVEQLGVEGGTFVNVIDVEMALLATAREKHMTKKDKIRMIGVLAITAVTAGICGHYDLWQASIAIGAAGLALIALSVWRNSNADLISRLTWNVENSRVGLINEEKYTSAAAMSDEGINRGSEVEVPDQARPPVEPIQQPVTAAEVFGDDWESEEKVPSRTPGVVNDSSAGFSQEQTVPAGVPAANIPSEETNGINGMVELGKAIRDVSDGKYQLIVPDEFFSGHEFEDCQGVFGDRFILGRVSGLANISSTDPKALDSYIDRIIGQTKEKDTAIALVPKGITPEQRARLTENGIRFIPVTDNIMQIRSLPPGLRSDIRSNTFAMMYAMRHIKNTDEPGTPIYETVKRYIRNRLVLVGTTPDAYINAVVNDIADIIVYAWLKPIEKYNADTEKIEHDTKSFPLVFA